MAHQAKVYASVQTFAKTPSGPVSFNLEWFSLGADSRRGKESLLIDTVGNAEQVTRDLQQALADRLSQKFAPEVFRARDISGCTA